MPSINPFLEAYAKRSADAVKQLSCQQDLRWGHGDEETFDFFPAAGTSTPLLVFIHGGYWQELSKSDSLFIAPDCISNGVAYAAIEYTLAPRASVVAIVDQCRRAIASLFRQAPALGCDPRRIFVAGSSAGAHLVAMLLVEGWQEKQGLPADCIAGAILASGIYDLQPLVSTYINRPLHLTETDAIALSPLTLPLRIPIPVIVSWGENETGEFKRQSRSFAAKLTNARFDVTSLEIPSANHFDIAFEIANGSSALGQATLAMIGAR